MKFLGEGPGHSHVFRDRKEIELRPAQDAERIGRLIEKSLRGDRNPQAKRGAKDVQNLLVTRASRVHAQLEVAGELFDLRRAKRLQLIQIERCGKIDGSLRLSRRSGDGSLRHGAGV